MYLRHRSAPLGGVLSFLMLLAVTVVHGQLLQQPPSANIARGKPLRISPSGSTCGMELKDVLCDNRLIGSYQCGNSNGNNSSAENGNGNVSTSTFYCDQSCPYGNVLSNLLAQSTPLALDNMEPCRITKDFEVYAAASSVRSDGISNYSYLIDQAETSSSCQLNKSALVWKPFDLSVSQSRPVLTFHNPRTPSPPAVLDSGFTVSFWFRQFYANNGYFFHSFITLIIFTCTTK